MNSVVRLIIGVVLLVSPVALYANDYASKQSLPLIGAEILPADKVKFEGWIVEFSAESKFVVVADKTVFYSDFVFKANDNGKIIAVSSDLLGYGLYLEVVATKDPVEAWYHADEIFIAQEEDYTEDFADEIDGDGDPVVSQQESTGRSDIILEDGVYKN